ncbi:MAG: ATP-binding protein [Bacteroidales bacterium]
MNVDESNSGIFENIPECGFTLDSRGVIQRYTQLAQSIIGDNQKLNGLKIQALIPAIKNKSLSRLHDLEFDFSHNKQSIHFRITVKQIETSKSEEYIVWLKDITNEHRQEKINRILLSISQFESISKDLGQFYRTIQDELNTLFDANNLYIVLFDKFRISLNLAYISDSQNTLQTYPRGNTIALWVAQTGRAVVLDQKQINRLQKKYNLIFFGPQALCWMGVPLKVKHDIIGVIAVQNYERMDAFTLEDLDVLKFISTQIAASILHKENERELLLAKEKAIESDKLKSAFLANMSHEIRTPMNAILGFSELVSRKNIQPEKREIYTQHIVNNGKLLLHLVDDIIDLAKIEAGQLKFKRNTTNVEELLIELMHFCISEKKRLKKDELDIVCEGNKGGHPMWLLCDSFRLKQVLLNLLSNALKFTFSGSVVFGYDIPNNATIQFYVKDSGIGIRPDQQTIIFDRFRQADDSATRQFGGTGLGLTISKKLVELMGGRIWVNSKSNEGSNFHFTLPLIIPDLNNNRLNESLTKILPDPIFKGKIALIVEDNEANYLYLDELLRPTGIKIIRASNGLDAINFAANNFDIDVILMDLQLPELDGFEATKRIKQINPKVPIIVQTAYALADEKNRAINAGCDHYLTKPISANTLLYLINQVFGNS